MNSGYQVKARVYFAVRPPKTKKIIWQGTQKILGAHLYRLRGSAYLSRTCPSSFAKAYDNFNKRSLPLSFRHRNRNNKKSHTYVQNRWVEGLQMNEKGNSICLRLQVGRTADNDDSKGLCARSKCLFCQVVSRSSVAVV